MIVSIHAPAWGATGIAITVHLAGVFQSTHPRGVRLCFALSADIFSEVSIHAPAWGATFRRLKFINYIVVSIHAPAWGATGALPCNSRSSFRFNPRTRVGCDMITRASGCIVKVSIHAPAWGATLNDNIERKN